MLISDFGAPPKTAMPMGCHMLPLYGNCVPAGFCGPPVFLQVLILIVVEVACFQRALEMFISWSLPPTIYSVIAGRRGHVSRGFQCLS